MKKTLFKWTVNLLILTSLSFSIALGAEETEIDTKKQKLLYIEIKEENFDDVKAQFVVNDNIAIRRGPVEIDKFNKKILLFTKKLKDENGNNYIKTNKYTVVNVYKSYHGGRALIVSDYEKNYLVNTYPFRLIFKGDFSEKKFDIGNDMFIFKPYKELLLNLTINTEDVLYLDLAYDTVKLPIILKVGQEESVQIPEKIIDLKSLKQKDDPYYNKISDKFKVKSTIIIRNNGYYQVEKVIE